MTFLLSSPLTCLTFANHKVGLLRFSIAADVRESQYGHCEIDMELRKSTSGSDSDALPGTTRPSRIEKPIQRGFLAIVLGFEFS